MTARKYEDLVEGEVVESQAITVTEAHVVHFAGLTGDFHPVHMDDGYAKQTPFGGRIAHGALVLSLAVALAGMACPLESIAFLGVSWRFVKPVAIGDTIRVRSTLLKKRLTSRGDRGIVHHRLEVLNQLGEVVQEGETHIMVVVGSGFKISP
ncbi:MAG: MaoC/PaaZ C-terminal domain-containing protein [Armatimonadota bacterium]|nr:MaoC/PaaZ C-terminal domain-containing protein [Armatimonadota bacterium]